MSKITMKITEIDERLWGALNHLCNFAEDRMEDPKSKKWKYFKGLKKSLSLVSEYAGCFNADGTISQQGSSPEIWNKNTIFESGGVHTKKKSSSRRQQFTPQEKDEYAKKLLKELS